MRIVELILVMSVFANTLNAVIEEKKVQIQEEKFIDGNTQRKLDENQNYVTFIFNQDFNFKINNAQNIINKITINDGEPQDLAEEINIKEGDKIHIYYNNPLSKGSEIYGDTNREIKSKIVLIDLSKFDSSNIEDINSMFNGCSSLKSINFLNFNTVKIKSMDSVFYGCSSLEELDLSSFDTSNVSFFHRLFEKCSSLKKLDLSHFDTSKVNAFIATFYGCSSLKVLDLSHFVTDNCENMADMFAGCSSLTSINLSSFKTSKVKRMGGLFSGCSSLKSINLSNFDTSSVEYMSSMFSGCSSLTSIYLSNFDTSKVTNMEFMFAFCSSLTSINLSNFNTSNVTNMGNMFTNCSSLTSIHLSNFDTSKVASMTMMFTNCSSLFSLNLSNFDTSKVINMDYMFQNCSCLKFLDISNFKITDEALTNRTNYISFGFPIFDIFFNNNNLEYINLYNTIDNGFISSSSINKIDNLTVCQKYNIITNPAAQNKCSEYDYNIKKDIYYDIIDTTIFSTSEFKDNEIDSTDFILSDSTIYSDNLNGEINSKVFLLGYTTFNIINSNMFSFFIYFISLKNTIYSQILYFSLTVTYSNNLRILQDNEEANCIKVEPNNEEFNKYNCTVLAKTSNIDNIELSTNFNFKPNTTFESFYISSLANMDLFTFPNITNKEYISPEIFILENSTAYKYNNTHFEIKGVIEKSNPKFEKACYLLIENNLSENDKFKKVNCIISNEISNNYSLMCLANENIEFRLLGSIAFSGNNLILINLENEKLTFKNTVENEPNQKQYSKKKESSKKWIIAVVIVPIVVLFIVIGIIVFVVRKRNPQVQEQSTTQAYLNQFQ